MSEAKVAELAKQVHDIRKPLNRISMQAELIKLVLEKNLPQQQAIDALDKYFSLARTVVSYWKSCLVHKRDSIKKEE